MPQILIVCTANVCRSPYAEVRLRSLLRAAGLSRVLSVASAGTAAVNGVGICSSGSRRLDTSELERAAAAEHVSRRLERGMLMSADLVLVPDLHNRAMVVALEPTARRRTFTLQEAALVPQRSSYGEAQASRRSHGSQDPLSAWMEALRSLRLTAQPPVTPRFALRPRAVRGIEIADGHNLGTRLHRRTLDAVEAACVKIAGSLEAVMEPPGQSPAP